MKKIIIGILGTSEYMKTNDAFYDVYKYSNNYIKKIVENDAVPLLIPLVDDKLIEETLDMCDGLLLPGGRYIKEVNFKVIDYFYQRKKPILGICMGMQTLAMYSVNIENKERKRIIKNKTMKILKTILAALVLAITASSCHKDGEQADATSPLKDSPVVAQQEITLNGDTIIVCDLSLLKDTIDLPLSTFVSDFELVDLGEDEEALIKETSGGGSIAVSPNYIGIYSGTGYKLFDKTGKYITSLSAQGQGPNEYAFSIYDSYIDEKNDRAYLLPMNGNKILVYDLKGNAQPYIPLAHETTKGKFYVDDQKKLLYVANMPFSDTASTFWIQDFEGKLIKEIIAGHLKIVPPDFSNDINVSMNTEEIDYSVFHWKNTVDTLYHYYEADNRLAPSFTVNFKDNPILHDYIELPDYYLIRLIEIESDYRYIYGLIDKKTLKGNYIKLKLDMLGNIDAPAWAIFERGLYTANIYAYYLQGQCDRLSDLSS